MGIAIDIIFVCAFYLELAPEWETTFTRKDREPLGCHIPLLFVHLTCLDRASSVFSVCASSSVSCTPARRYACTSTPPYASRLPIWDPSLRKGIRRSLAGKSSLVVQFSLEKKKREETFFWFESALILVLCDKQK